MPTYSNIGLEMNPTKLYFIKSYCSDAKNVICVIKDILPTAQKISLKDHTSSSMRSGKSDKVLNRS